MTDQWPMWVVAIIPQRPWRLLWWELAWAVAVQHASVARPGPDLVDESLRQVVVGKWQLDLKKLEQEVPGSDQVFAPCVYLRLEIVTENCWWYSYMIHGLWRRHLRSLSFKARNIAALIRAVYTSCMNSERFLQCACTFFPTCLAKKTLINPHFQGFLWHQIISYQFASQVILSPNTKLL